MPDYQQGFIDEVKAAGRGALALILGDRRAPQYFDFSEKGLVGSFIGLLAITFVSAVLSLVLPGANPGYSIAKATAGAVILFCTQIGFVYIVLRQINRVDGFRPYLVADNWTSVFVSIGTLLLSFVGFRGDIAIIVLAILMLMIEINIARLIVTLSPLQIAMFMIAQLVGVSIALIVVGLLFPSPEVQAAISSLQR